MRRLAALPAAALLAALGACAPAGAPTDVAAGTAPASPTSAAAAATTTPAPPSTERSHTGPPAVTPGSTLRVVEVGRRPHDTSAFTQGLEFEDGRLYESRGLYGDQEDVILTEVDPQDGTRILRQVDRPDGDTAFHEGLTVVGDRVVQLTWQSGFARVYDLATLEERGQLRYEGEGWGVCDDGDVLRMTNGTPTLTTRDPATFEVLDEVTVTLGGAPVDELNEVECVDGLVWANVWRTDRIVVIDPADGEVVAEVDASALADADGRYVGGGGADVLNGIAFDPSTGTWLLTGKLWPFMFEVVFECVDGCGPAITPSHYTRQAR
jgi:glutaminyl-peptide cyclotransferase